MRRILYEEIKKIFMQPIIWSSLVVFILTSVYFVCFVSGGSTYYYDTDKGTLIEISSPSKIIDLNRMYTNIIKGTITDKKIEYQFKNYQNLINGVNNYANEKDLQRQKDRRFELLGAGYSEEEVDKIDEKEPIYELNQEVKYNELWRYQPISHLFKLYSGEYKDRADTLRELLAKGTTFDWCGGYANAINCANNILSIGIGLLIILGISTILSEEVQYNIKGIIFTTKYGKRELLYGKIGSLFLYTTIITIIAVLIDLFVSQQMYKLGNGEVYIQLSKEFMDYNVLISHGNLFWIEWICIFIGALYLAAIVLFISSICNSDFVSIFLSIVVYLVFNLGTLLLNTEEHIWKLFLPTTLMHPLQYFQKDYNLFGLGKNNYTIAILFGIFFTFVFFTLSLYTYKREKGRTLHKY